MHRSLIAVSVLLIALILAPPRAFAAATWQAGVATVDVTPAEHMWMSGYAARKKPAEGKDLALYAKAIALVDPAGNKAVMVTMDLIGIGRPLSLEVREAIEKKHGLKRSQIALCTSHTHAGPVVGRNLMAMYFLDDRQKKLVDEYSRTLKKKLLDVVDRALADAQPCEIAYGTGKATFAVNRRNNPADKVAERREAGTLVGPHDHDVPVIRIIDAKGELKAVIFGYACHATTLSYFRWSGDYPGYAQQYIEKKHPGAVALFWAGCGADQNPLPRRTVVLAEQYGQLLADAVSKTVANDMTPIKGALATTYNEIDLKFEKLPTRDELVEQSESTNVYVASRAKLLLEQIDAGHPLSPTYPYPIQTWRIGDELILITMGGEVVVDFALRFKKAFGEKTTFVAGYTNDVMAYIPSLRVWKEGGYEGGGAMVYYGLPSRWAPDVEEAIAKEGVRQVKKVNPAAGR